MNPTPDEIAQAVERLQLVARRISNAQNGEDWTRREYDSQIIEREVLPVFRNALAALRSAQQDTQIISYMIGTGKCPLLVDSKLAYVSVPGFSRKAFELAETKLFSKFAAALTKSTHD